MHEQVATLGEWISRKPQLSENECKVIEIKEYGGTHHTFVGEVLSINADEKYIDKNGAFDISKCNLISYQNGGYYATGRKIGKFGYSVEKNKKR